MSNSTIKYFKYCDGLVFYAINLEEQYFVTVELFSHKTAISIEKGLNSTKLQLITCAKRNDIPILEFEFSEAITQADQILHNTPFL